MTAANKEILIEKRGAAFWITINRPDARNAVNTAVATGIEDAIDQVEADDEIPEACDSTLLIAERVQSYADVWTPRDRMPVFPVPERFPSRQRNDSASARTVTATVPPGATRNE